MNVEEVTRLDTATAVIAWVDRLCAELSRNDQTGCMVEIHIAAGDRLTELGDYGTAVDYYNMALDACDACEDEIGVIDCQLKAAQCFSLRNDTHTCLHLATAALEQARALDYSSGIATALLTIGNSRWKTEQVTEAREVLTEARQLFLHLGDHYQVANTDLSLGTVAAMSKEFDAAEETYLSALEYFRQQHLDELTYRTLNNLAGVMFQRHDFVKARAYLEECRAYNPHGRGALPLNIVYNLGLLDVHEGKLDSARKNLNRALMLAREASSIDVEAKVLLNLGLTSLYAHELDEAVNYLDLAALRAQGRQQSQRPVAVIQRIIQMAAGQLAATAELPEPVDKIDTEVLWQAIPALEFIQAEAAAGKLELTEAVRELATQWAAAMRRALDAHREPQPG